MTYQVDVTEQAESDLQSIFEYIAFQLKAFQTAIEQLDRLEKSILSLDTFPERFRQYQKEPWKSKGLRVMSVDNYLVFYITDEQIQTVTVIRVMYAARDVETQLNYFTDI